MKKDEARALLTEQIERLRAMSYEELLGFVEPHTAELTGSSGVIYQVEIEAVWDEKRSGTLRVMAMIDDMGWSAFMPSSMDFIIAPDGSFVDD